MQEDTRKPPVLEKRIVCFIDILGFASLVSAARSDEAKARLVDNALGHIQQIADLVEERKGSRPDVHIFSDCAIISTEVSPHAVSALLDALAELTWKLMCLGIKIRGAVTIGEMSSNRDRPWGPAVVDAYRLENTVAVHPRIALHGTLVKYIAGSARELLDLPLLKRDTDDGVHFLNAFAHRLGTELPTLPKEVPRSELEAVRDHLSWQHSELTEKPDVYRKIDWLRDLWDSLFTPYESLWPLQTSYGHEQNLVRHYRSLGDFDDNLDRAAREGRVLDGDFSKLPQA